MMQTVKVGGKIPYFAYGANMSSQKMKERIGVLSIQKQPCQVVAEDVCLSFSHRGGYANLIQNQKGDIQSKKSHDLTWPMPHGVLYMLTEAELKLTARSETGYKKWTVPVRSYNGEITDACVFISEPSLCLVSSVRPTCRYLALLKSGAAENNLDKDYQSWLCTNDCIASDKLGPEYFDTPSVMYTNIGFMTVLAIAIAFLVFMWTHTPMRRFIATTWLLAALRQHILQVWICKSVLPSGTLSFIPLSV